MARLVTAKEVDSKIKELQDLRKNMTQPEHRACLVCGDLYTVGQREYQTCWCDYESPAINY